MSAATAGTSGSTSTVAFLRRLWATAAPDRRLFAGLATLTVLDVLALVPGPLLFAWLVERIVAGLQTRDLVVFAIAYLSLELLGGALRIARVNRNRLFAMQAANRLRDRFFGHLLALPWSWFLQRQSGGQASHYLSDIDDVDEAIGGLVERGLRSLLTLLVLSLTLAIWNPLVALAALVLFPTVIVLQRALRRLVKASSREKVELRQEMTGLIAEAVAHPDLLKSSNLERTFDARLAAVSARFRDAEIVMETGQAALRSTASVLLIFAQYAFFVIGALLVIHVDLAIGAFLGQMLLVARLTAPMNALLEYGNSLARSQAALGRVEATLATPGEQPDDAPRQRLPADLPGLGVELEDLRFRHEGDLPLIEGWSLRIAPGETVAIVGPSGSGKTTLFNLLIGLHRPQGGTIRYQGLAMETLDLADLRRRIGVVFQEQELFNATVRENLAIAGDAPFADDQLWWALDRASAADFVRALPHGLETRIGVDGVKLSGGQRQRLSLAQAILKNPPLLLLDEATSALDTLSEQQIQLALRELFVGRTNIVIAHRLSTVVDADRIVVIDEGRIVEQGSHAGLLAAGGLYRRLVDAQSEGLIDWRQLADDDGPGAGDDGDRG